MIKDVKFRKCVIKGDIVYGSLTECHLAVCVDSKAPLTAIKCTAWHSLTALINPISSSRQLLSAQKR